MKTVNRKYAARSEFDLAVSLASVLLLVLSSNALAQTKTCELPELTGPAELGDMPVISANFFVQFTTDLVAYELAGGAPNSTDCFISVTDLQTPRRARQFTLIDVRDSADISTSNMPTVLNMPLHQIKTKHFLKTKALVLIDESYKTEMLIEHCVALKQQGFNRVYVLAGGLEAWQRASAAPTATKTLNQISAQDFYLMPNKMQWLILDVSGQSESIAESVHILEFDRQIPTAMLQQQLNSAISAFKEQHNLMPKLLVVDESAQHYTSLAAKLTDAQVTDLYFLTDGLAGHKKFAQRMHIVQAKAKQPDRKARRCGASL